MSRRYSIIDMKKYAADHGGKCLSKEYINLTTSLKWQCKIGHTWDADFQIIKQGGWCPACIKSEKVKEEQLEILKKIALEREGECLSKSYINSSTKLKFKCKTGHIWLMRPNDIKNQKQWCPKCGVQKSAASRRNSIERFHKLAKQKGGILLSTQYINGHSKLLWQCARGNQWQADGAMVLHAKSWCPYCRGMHKTIKDMQELAAKRQGKCLSKKYINSTAKLKWQCEKGHVWSSAPYNIINNCWCPTCGYVTNGAKQNDNIEKYRKAAIKKGGKLLTNEYVNNNTPMLWQCKIGHKWMARGANVYHMNSWCPVCYDIKRGRKIPRKSMI